LNEPLPRPGNYPVADMFFPPHELVAAISKDVTLMPGDIIACGTSLGAGTMGDAHNVVDIVIDGVGKLSNIFDQVLPSPYLLGAPPKQKKICVVGAGAIGGLLAAKFALAGEDVTVIDQGAHLAAIQRNGLTLEWHDGKVQAAKMKAVNKPTEAGKQDIVVLAVKAHFLDQVVRDIESMLGPETVVLTVQNGLPWWYFQKLGGQYDNHKLESLDPSGVLTKNIDPNRLIGCVVYPAAAATAPGVIHHVEGDRFPIGELDGKETPRVKELLKSLVLPDIRSEIWLKAWGNLSFNPISALTHATLVDIAVSITANTASQCCGRLTGIPFSIHLSGEKKPTPAQSTNSARYSWA
jgi:ketopantoate reductase